MCAKVTPNLTDAYIYPLEYARWLTRFVGRSSFKDKRFKEDFEKMEALEMALRKDVSRLTAKYGGLEALKSPHFDAVIKTLTDMYEIAKDVAERKLEEDPHDKDVIDFIKWLPYYTEEYEGEIYVGEDYPTKHQTIIAELIENLTGIETYIEEDLSQEGPVLVLWFSDDEPHILTAVAYYETSEYTEEPKIVYELKE